MRVTHIITRLVIGGAQENTVATVLGLREKPGVEPLLISGPTRGPEGSLEPAFAPFPQILTLVPSLVRPVHPVQDARALFALRKLLRSQRPQVVHTHSGKAGVLGRLAARDAGVPVIIHHIHGPSFGPFQGRLANWLFTAAERYAARATTHFVCSAQAMTRRYLAAGIGRPEMYTRVFSGFRIDPFVNATNDLELRRSLGFGADQFVIGKIARLAPLKGHEDLLKAFQALLPGCPQARLLLVGDGPQGAEIRQLARRFGLMEKVVFTGLVPPLEVARYVGIMDCLAHLSSREALSRALPQALAGGKPVVSYDFDGADEVCLEGQTGFLVRTGDVAGVVRALQELAGKPDLRRQLGQQGQSFVQQHFKVEKMVDDLYELYLKLLSQHG
ncbi:MAG TPA: glycosyltransferase family 4 protein [Methylomirabilota bacterium]|jgi:glycosyltransferase involved in cell wall biosynthesis|nr:glycosyltransferase family 4 protein [Methylomirabilota bacterium]